MITYDYKVFRADTFLQVFGAVRFQDAYISADQESDTLRQVLAEGYRLHMLTSEYAILEHSHGVQNE